MSFTKEPEYTLAVYEVDSTGLQSSGWGCLSPPDFPMVVIGPHYIPLCLNLFVTRAQECEAS